MGPKIKPQFSVNPRVGQRPVFRFEFPEEFVLIVDSNEQDPLFLPRPMPGLKLIRKHLPVGDYSILGFESEISLERKSVSDLYGSLFSDWDRELAKLTKLSAFDHKWLMIEGSEDQVLRWQEYTGVHPNSMRGRLTSIEIRLKIPVHYEPKRDRLERWVLDRLIKFYKVKKFDQ